MFKSIFHNHLPEWVALPTVTIWGTNFAIQKALLAEITPWAYLWARFAGIGVFVAEKMQVGAAPIFVLALPDMLAQNWAVVSAGAWLALAWSIIAPVWLAWTLWSWVNARRGVARTSVFMYLVPLVGGIASWALLGDSFTPLKLAGAALALIGMLVARRMANRRPGNADRRPQTTGARGETAAAGAGEIAF